jgi:hypothetical protein
MAEPEVDEVQRIYRAAFTLQAVFLRFREATWHNHILEIHSKDKQILILDDPNHTNRFNGWFSPFPNHLLDDARVKAAVLTTMSCYDMAHMKELVEQLFAGRTRENQRRM